MDEYEHEWEEKEKERVREKEEQRKEIERARKELETRRRIEARMKAKKEERHGRLSSSEDTRGGFSVDLHTKWRICKLMVYNKASLPSSNLCSDATVWSAGPILCSA